MTKPSENEGQPGFDRRMTKDEINVLPMRHYEGPIRVVRSREELPEVIAELEKEKVLGFDTETRPSFKKGESYPPALIQLSSPSVTYLFQLSDLKFPRELRKVLSNPDIIKAGVALVQDVVMLQAMGTFKPAGLVDLAEVAKKVGIQNHGLRGLTAVLLGFRISKAAQVSNWARKDLTVSQITYAATDSWVSRELYLKLKARGAEMTLMDMTARREKRTKSSEKKSSRTSKSRSTNPPRPPRDPLAGPSQT